MEKAEEALARKQAFFDRLLELGDDTKDGDEDEQDEGHSEAAQFLMSAPRVPRKRRKQRNLLNEDLKSRAYIPHRLDRTVSSPLPNSSKSSIEAIQSSTEAPVATTRPIEMGKKKGFDEPGKVKAKAKTKVLGKRKRGQSLDLVSESQQIFKGLSFYFFPNNDKSPARAFRIRKAIQWGAVWVKDWSDDVTHIISDKGLNYEDLLKYLKFDALPSSVVLVNEVYPVECLIFRYLVDPNQRQYQVDGHQLLISTEPHVPSQRSSIASLPLKPDRAKPPRTPSRSEGSDELAASRSIEAANLAVAEEVKAAAIRAQGKGAKRDALDEAIEETMTTIDLLIESDDDAHFSFDEAYISDKDVRAQDGGLSKTRKLDPKTQQNFSCMQKNEGASKDENPNGRTIEVLQQMADYYDRTKDQWRLLSYRKAITVLRKLPNKITTKEEAFAIHGIGERLAEKIEEIVSTNHLRRLDNVGLEPNDAILQMFTKIYGVGYFQAQQFIAQGHRTLEDLRLHANLSTNQRLGIAHYDDFQARIPRREVELHGRIVREAFAKVDPTIEITIGGSYRRGSPTCGDVDYIVTKPNCPISALRTLVCDTIIPRLFIQNYLKAALATTSAQDGSKWHGAAALPSSTVWRRVDFLLVPWDEMGAALIYFTGNDIFNRSIRLLASKKGMRLNQRGLFKDVLRGPGRKKITQGTLVESRSERKIFEILGVPWRPPEHRIC